jgi:predicted lipoprotein with Yx(FWY)xxD motif
MSTQDRRAYRTLVLRTVVTVVTVVAGGALAACGGQAGNSGTAATSSDAVAARAVNHPGLGRILVDAGGRTLYFADQESDGTVRCVGDCLEFWFPAKSPERNPAATGVAKLDVLHRSDNGANQLTYQGKPLYTFQLDKASGDTNGHNLEDDFGGTHFVWHAVTVDGDATPTPSTTADGGDGGYGGGY